VTVEAVRRRVSLVVLLIPSDTLDMIHHAELRSLQQFHQLYCQQ